MELEKQIENPDNERVRLVGGKDLVPVELQKKIDDVNMLLQLTFCSILLHILKSKKMLKISFILDAVTYVSEIWDESGQIQMWGHIFKIKQSVRAFDIFLLKNYLLTYYATKIEWDTL